MAAIRPDFPIGGVISLVRMKDPDNGLPLPEQPWITNYTTPVLRYNLRLAVEEENYELAAKIRDELKSRIL